MVVKLQRPILVGGLGLSFSILMLQSLHHSLLQLGEFGAISLLVAGGGGLLWLLKPNRPKNNSPVLESLPADRTTPQKAIAKAEIVVNQLTKEAENHPAVATLEETISLLYQELDREEILVAVTGGKSVGKTSLIEVLKSNWCPQIRQKVSWEETPPLFLQETPQNSDAAALAQAKKADFVLFLSNGDLTDTEFQAIQQLKAENQQLMLVFNKQDRYLPDERASILLSVKQRMQETTKVVATAVSPLPVKVRKHAADGSVQQWSEQPPPDIQQLTQQLDTIFAQQGQQLIWATTMRKAFLLQAEAKNYLNQVRRERASVVIEQYQWIAAAAAFANPVPALDILATAAINAQTIVDLGQIYQQKFSLEQAKIIASEMGSLMLKLGLVELSSRAIATVLKSHAATFIAGGLVQGISAAYLTRLAGWSLVEYFQQQEVTANSTSRLNIEKLGQTLQKVFQQNQQMGFLQGFVHQGIKLLSPEVTAGELTATNKVVG
jgi:GTPase SAR1 family protein